MAVDKGYLIAKTVRIGKAQVIMLLPTVDPKGVEIDNFPGRYHISRPKSRSTKKKN
jgi:hypothetical protein